jgi:hypothetical protein
VFLEASFRSRAASEVAVGQHPTAGSKTDFLNLARSWILGLHREMALTRDVLGYIVTRYVLQSRGSIPGGGIYHLSLRNIQISSTTLPASYPMSTENISPRIKRPEREADHSPSPTSEVSWHNSRQLHLHVSLLFLFSISYL